MKFCLGVNANETVPEAVGKSVEAERLGLDCVWVSDAPTQRYAPTVAAAVAAKTRKIKIGLGLISPFLHSPLQIATCFRTLVEAHGERFELCIGSGDRNLLKRVGVPLFHSLGVVNYLMKAKEEITQALQKEKVDSKIWLGAQGPRMLENARHFDGILLNYAQPNLIKWAINEVGTAKDKDFEFGIFSPSYVYADYDPKIHRLLRIAGATVALGASKTILKRLELFQEVAEAKEKLEAGAMITSVMNEVSRKAVDMFSIFKNASELGEYLKEISAMGVEYVVFSYPQNHSMKTVRELAQALKSIR